MRKTPSLEQIDVEIASLVAVKPHVRKVSGLDHDNHAAIDAQLAVLRERLAEDAIYERFGTQGDYDSQFEGEDDDTQHTIDSALEARRWLDGEATVLADNWKTAIG